MATTLMNELQALTRPEKARSPALRAPAPETGALEGGWLAEYARSRTVEDEPLAAGGEAPGVEIAAVTLPGRSGPNDLHDTFRLSEDVLALVVADTWSAGTCPGALRGFIRSVVRDLCSCGRSPGGALTHLNRMLVDARPDDALVSLFLGWLDLRTGHLIHANAGHPHPLRVNLGGEVRSFGEVTGPTLGVQDIPVYTGGDAVLEPGETVVVYTDGVIESGGGARRFLGDQGLSAILERHAPRPAAAICAAVAREVVQEPSGRRDDDATILAVRWEGPRLTC